MADKFLDAIFSFDQKVLSKMSIQVKMRIVKRRTGSTVILIKIYIITKLLNK